MGAYDLEGEESCELVTGSNCGFWKVATFGFNLNRTLANSIGAFCILILALTSSVA